MRNRLAHMAVALMLAAGSLAVALTVADRVANRRGFGLRPMRGRANQDRVLRRGEFSVRVVTNALGFREKRLPGPAPQGVRRIVALGDSFTQGYGVEAPEAFPSQLEALLGEHFEVINLGIPGACPLDYVHHLREVGLAYQPDLVLVGVMANDMNDIRERRQRGRSFVPGVLQQVQASMLDDRPAWKRIPSQAWPTLYELAGTGMSRLKTRLEDSASAPAVAQATPSPSEQHERAKRAPVVPESRWREVLLELANRYGRRSEVETELARMNEGDLARLRPVLTGEWRFESELDQDPLWRLTALLEPDVFVDSVLLPPSYDAAWEEMTGKLSEIDRLARAAGARTMIVFIPAAQQIMPAMRSFLQERGFRWDERVLTDTTFSDRLNAFGGASGIPVVDLLGPLRADAAYPRYFIADGHWTPEGHELGARLLAARIKAAWGLDVPNDAGGASAAPSAHTGPTDRTGGAESSRQPAASACKKLHDIDDPAV